jgi:hypothetical protein
LHNYAVFVEHLNLYTFTDEAASLNRAFMPYNKPLKTIIKVDEPTTWRFFNFTPTHYTAPQNRARDIA